MNHRSITLEYVLIRRNNFHSSFSWRLCNHLPEVDIKSYLYTFYVVLLGKASYKILCRRKISFVCGASHGSVGTRTEKHLALIWLPSAAMLKSSTVSIGYRLPTRSHPILVPHGYQLFSTSLEQGLVRKVSQALNTFFKMTLSMEVFPLTFFLWKSEIFFFCHKNNIFTESSSSNPRKISRRKFRGCSLNDQFSSLQGLVVGGEGATFAASYWELRDVVTPSCSPSAAGSHGKEYSATAARSDSRVKSTAALTASESHSTNPATTPIRWTGTFTQFLIMTIFPLCCC